MVAKITIPVSRGSDGMRSQGHCSWEKQRGPDLFIKFKRLMGWTLIYPHNILRQWALFVFSLNLLLQFHVYIFQVQIRYQKSINRSKHERILIGLEIHVWQIIAGNVMEKRRSNAIILLSLERPRYQNTNGRGGLAVHLSGAGLIEISSRGHRATSNILALLLARLTTLFTWAFQIGSIRAEVWALRDRGTKIFWTALLAI